MFKKLAVIAAASSMVLATTAAQASSASALSLRHAPAVETRASTSAAKQSNLLPGSPLFAIIGIIAVVGLLEATEVINIFGDDDADSN
ncbi:hypothetical protein MZO42_00565 [Sphingomonas psychrotolerans]|uniref:Uncharacterized protein n=1 Tax=Sphingomonas psychrotolerans TaxID=1327635 RepID=A0ABU3MY74_9SPHN|nr:hypothetical protein [Sphingomonas psychrotolerans]MDT8757177.1 hypothetical protein [Sphingomonas psychrotolerans]